MEAWGEGEVPRVDQGKQDKHIPGSRNYDPTRSMLTTDPQQLLDAYAGKGEPANTIPRGQPDFRERFDTNGEVIGSFRDQPTGRLPRPEV